VHKAIYEVVVLKSKLMFYPILMRNSENMSHVAKL